MKKIISIDLLLLSCLMITNTICEEKKQIQVPKVKLNNGLEMPQLGLGTWLSETETVTQAVKDAIDAGYRHFDCAWLYKNEKEVGDGIKAKIDEGVVKREDLFIVSKLWNTFHSPENVETAFNKSLTDLGLDYLDLYLMHGPTDFKPEGDKVYTFDKDGFVIPEGIDYIDTWKAIEKIYEKGLTKSIGVSNFNSKQIDRLLTSSKIVPVTNQVEAHPYLNQKKLAEFCKSKGIIITAYSPLASPNKPWAKREDLNLLNEPIIKDIGKKFNKTPAQVVLRYLIQLGYVVIPKSVHKNRIEENINVFDFELSPEDMKQIDSFDRKDGRTLKLEVASKHRFYAFNEEF